MSSRIRIFLVILNSILLVSLQNQIYAKQPENERVKNVFANMHPADSAYFSKKEKNFIQAAQNYLDSRMLSKKQAKFKISKDGSHYLIFVLFYDLDSNGNKLYFLEGHCTLKLNEKAEVLEFFPGG